MLAPRHRAAVVLLVLGLVGLAAPAGVAHADTAPVTTTTTAATTTSYRSPVYALKRNWLCRPDVRDDACDIDLDATLVRTDGSEVVERFRPARNPKVDCFYVYPTISSDRTANSDLQAGDEERGAVANQFARFGSVCRLFAPIYRQVPLAGLGAFGGATPTTAPGALPPFEIAYRDVVAAFRSYLAHDSKGRPFVLIGHSQGSGHLSRLIQEQIEPNRALRRRLVSALLIGGQVAVPGATGAFTHLPPCAATSRTKVPLRCVVGYNTFDVKAPPPAGSLFGRLRSGGGRVVCVNPANLSTGPAPLSSYFRSGGTVSTPWVHYRGLLTGECVQDASYDWLQVTNTAQPGDARPSDVGGRITPVWGLHLIDVNVAQGDLVSLVGRQARAFTAPRG